MSYPHYSVTKVLGDTDYVDIKMRVVSSIKSLHLSGPTAQISSSSQQNICPEYFSHPVQVINLMNLRFSYFIQGLLYTNMMNLKI